MLTMRVLWLSVCTVGLLFVTPTESTLGALTAFLPAGALVAAPALAAVGGVSAVKILKAIGLAKLKSKVASGISSGISGVFQDQDEYDDYNYNSYQQPLIYGPPRQPDGPPLFYIVPRASYDRYRGKRDLQAANSAKAPQTITEEDYFNVIGTMDVNGCIRNLVCELAQKPEDQLEEDEKIIMSIFDTSVEPTESSVRTYKDVYEYAAWKGRHSPNNPETCRNINSNCKFSAQEIMEAYWKLEIQDISQNSQESRFSDV